MIINKIIEKDIFIFKNNNFFLEERKKEEYLTALEKEETGPKHPKVESP